MAEQLKKIKLLPHSIEVAFLQGYFANHCYTPADAASVFRLVEAAALLRVDMLVEVESKENGRRLHIYSQNNSFCVFYDTHQFEICILGAQVGHFKTTELIQICDDRWELTYFLPKSAFIDFDSARISITEYLGNGEYGTHSRFSQTFPSLGLPDGYC